MIATRTAIGRVVVATTKIANEPSRTGRLVGAQQHAHDQISEGGDERQRCRPGEPSQLQPGLGLGLPIPPDHAADREEDRRDRDEDAERRRQPENRPEGRGDRAGILDIGNAYISLAEGQ